MRRHLFISPISVERQKQELTLAVPLILSGMLAGVHKGPSLSLLLGHGLTLLTPQGKLVLWAPPGTCYCVAH